jgi:hypothetical protein
MGRQMIAFYMTWCYMTRRWRRTLRVFVVKAFRRFQRNERISDEALCEAIGRAERGLVDADLGGGLIKQRVARKGQGRSGGYRTIIAYRAGDRCFFLKGFAKSSLANVDAREHKILANLGRSLLGMNDDEIDAYIVESEMTEIDYDAEG